MFTLCHTTANCGLKKSICWDNRPPNAHILRFIFRVPLHYAATFRRKTIHNKNKIKNNIICRYVLPTQALSNPVAGSEEQSEEWFSQSEKQKKQSEEQFFQSEE